MEKARKRYYNLDAHGFDSLVCDVKGDWTTLPVPLKTSLTKADLQKLDQSQVQLVLETRGARVNIAISPGASTSVQGALGLTQALVSGFFNTWPSKGRSGPIPLFDKQIQSVTSVDRGYVFILDAPGGPVEVETTKEFVATRIHSAPSGNDIDEHPMYSETPDGLIYVGNDADSKQGEEKTHIHFDIEYAQIHGLQLPSRIHVIVDQNVDFRFSLSNCNVKAGTVVHVAP